MLYVHKKIKQFIVLFLEKRVIICSIYADIEKGFL